MHRVRYLFSVVMVLALVSAAAVASASKTVLLFKKNTYVCYAANDCRYQYSEEEWGAVTDASQLVGTSQEVWDAASTYPHTREVSTWYYYAECSGNICPTPAINKPEGR